MLDTMCFPHLRKNVMTNSNLLAHLLYCSAVLHVAITKTHLSYGCSLLLFLVLWNLSACFLCRLLHWPLLYRKIHKIHHEWTAPISISSLYCHPVEFLLSNMIPLLAGPLLLGSHAMTYFVWVCIGLASTTISHCGFHLPFMPSNESHDYHHSQ